MAVVVEDVGDFADATEEVLRTVDTFESELGRTVREAEAIGEVTPRVVVDAVGVARVDGATVFLAEGEVDAVLLMTDGLLVAAVLAVVEAAVGVFEVVVLGRTVLVIAGVLEGRTAVLAVVPGVFEGRTLDVAVGVGGVPGTLDARTLAVLERTVGFVPAVLLAGTLEALVAVVAVGLRVVLELAAVRAVL